MKSNLGRAIAILKLNHWHILTQCPDALLEGSHPAHIRPDDVGFPLKAPDFVEPQLAVGVIVDLVTSLPVVTSGVVVFDVPGSQSKAADDEE